MADTRTVLEVLRDDKIRKRRTHYATTSAEADLAALGIPTDLPFDKFKAVLDVGISIVETPERAARMTEAELDALDAEATQIDRWLRYGKNADKLRNWPHPKGPYGLGFDHCLDAIKGDD